MKYLTFFGILFFIIVLLGGEWYEAYALSGMVVYLYYFLNSFSRRVLIFELTCLMAILTWMVVPLIFFNYFTINNELARLWDKFMRVPPQEYYAFVAPATTVFILGLHIPLSNREVLNFPKELFEEIRDYIRNKPVVGFILILIGICSTLINPYVPGSTRFILYLFEHLSFVGVLYLYFSNIPRRSIVLVMAFLALLIQAISSAMFGELLFISFLVCSLLMSTVRFGFLPKLSFLIIGLFSVVLLQSIKHEYRTIAWEKGASPLFFVQAIGDRVSNPSKLIDSYALFTMANRANQGWLIAKTMYHVPKDYSFANGETVLKSLAAVLVPRFLWPGKPESGGKANLKRFWGMDIKGYSMNIGPVGEAYANFGRRGGIVFMLFYGLVLNMILNFILGVVKRYPTLLLWFPILFLYPIGTETDILSTLNPLFKISVFILFVFLIFPRLLSVKLG